MTISGMSGLVKKNTVRRSDRGGNYMNLFNRVLMKLGYDDKRRKHMNEAENIIDDYGYVLYQSLEYNIKQVRNSDIGFVINPFSSIR